jgi:hypothetical protein
VTPADEITAAADKLEPLAKSAQHDLETADYWKLYDPSTAWADGFINGFGGASSDLVALLPPAAVTELVRWLRAEARRLTHGSLPDWQNTVSPHAVALARIINGGQQ